MKGFEEAYKSIFDYYNAHESHENPFYISNMYWIHFISDDPGKLCNRPLTEI